MHLNELHAKLDSLWSEFWPATELRPLAVVDFINCIILTRQLSETQSWNDSKNIFNGDHPGHQGYSIDHEELQWSSLKNREKESLYSIFNKQHGILDLIKSTEAYKTLRKFDNEAGDIKPIPELLAKTAALVGQLDLGETARNQVNDYLITKADLASKQRDLELTDPSLRVPSKNIVETKRKLAGVYVLLFIIFLGGLAATVFYFQFKKQDTTTVNQESEQAAIKDNKNDSLMTSVMEKKSAKKKLAIKKSLKPVKKKAVKKENLDIISSPKKSDTNTVSFDKEEEPIIQPEL